MMKNVLLIGALILSLASLAQDKNPIATALETTPNMQASSDLLQFNKETQNGFSVYLNSTLDMAEKQWKSFLEDTYQAEVKKSKGGLECESTTMADINDSPLTVTAFFQEDERGCKMRVFYNMNGFYLNSKEHPKESTAVLTQLKKYQKQLYVVTFEDVLTTERKIHDDETKSLEKLKKEEEKVAKDISSEDSDVDKAEQDIIDAEKEITELQAKIKELRGEIKESKSTKIQLIEAKNKKSKEIVNQERVVAEQAARIERIKSSSDRLNN